MTPQRRQWLVVGIVLTVIAATIVAYSGVMNARSNARWEQTPPGSFAQPSVYDSTSIRLDSLVVSTQLVTDDKVDVAPAGTVWVVAAISYQPPPGGGVCALSLIAVDGRVWHDVSRLELEGDRPTPASCLEEPGPTPHRAELIYRIPQEAAGQLAGLAVNTPADRTLDPSKVLTPPA